MPSSAALPQAKSQTAFLEILRRVRKRWYCYVMMSGTFVLLVAFAYYPAASAIYHSFTNWDGFRHPEWVGLKNYRSILTSDTIMHSAVPNMVLLGLWQILRAAIFPFLGAAMVYRIRNEKLAYFFRLLYVLPILVPGTVFIQVWRQLYDPNVGLFNELLKFVGMKPLLFLNDPKTALFSLMFIGFPWIDGVGLLVYLAGLLAIPREVIEAAIVDGAGDLRRLVRIELPLVVPQIRLIVILNVINALQSFGWQLLVTQGGPIEATTVPAWEMYRAAMVESRFGAASAMGMLLFVSVFLLTLINNAAIRSNIEYQGG